MMSKKVNGASRKFLGILLLIIGIAYCGLGGILIANSPHAIADYLGLLTILHGGSHMLSAYILWDIGSLIEVCRHLFNQNNAEEKK